MPFENLIKVEVKKHEDEIRYERGNDFISIRADVESGVGNISSNLGISQPCMDHIDDLYNAAVEGMESFLLAMACAGVNMEDQKIAEAAFTAADGINNNT